MQGKSFTFTLCVCAQRELQTAGRMPVLPEQTSQAIHSPYLQHIYLKCHYLVREQSP